MQDDGTCDETEEKILKLIDKVEKILKKGKKSRDSDRDGFPEAADPAYGSVSIGTSIGCDHSTYTECFYAREMLEINDSMRIDDTQFAMLMAAVYLDIKDRDRTASDRARYDTPFWDAGGDAPGQACFANECYGRAEVNYFAQGMWSAANKESLWYGEKVVVGAWKRINHTLYPETYPSATPSEGTLFWFDVGYLVYTALDD